jgi:hypothetical protein
MLKCSAASRRDVPSSTAKITRSRKSQVYAFGIAAPSIGRINAHRLAHFQALGNPFDSDRPEHALIEFTPTRLAFEIARTDHKYVEVTYDLDAKRFGEVQRIVHIIFGVQG